MDPTKNYSPEWTLQNSYSCNLLSPDTRIVTSPDGKGVILVGVGNDNNQPTTTLMEWHEIDNPWNEDNHPHIWAVKNMTQTLNVARKGFVVVPVSDKWTSCSKYLTLLPI